MALYPAAVKRLIPPGKTDPRITPKAAILHVDAGNADSLYHWFNGPSGGVESHFHIKRTGVVEQYRDTDYEADAQMGPARGSVSIETQGLAAGQWTPEQVAALVALLKWLSTVHPIPLRLNTTETPEGIGWHSQYPSWTGGDGRTCPGVDRIPQIRTQIMPALAQEDDVTPDDIKAIANEILGRPVRDLEGNTVTVGAAIGYSLRNSIATARALKALADTLPQEAADAVLDALDDTYDATVELTPKESA